jgi:hypothetical protein
MAAMKPQRWGWRFSIRTLFVTVTCVALGLAVAAAIHRRGVRQHRAFDEVRRLGGGAGFEPNTKVGQFVFFFHDVSFVNFSGPSISDEHLSILSEFPRLSLSLDHCAAITDRSVPVLKSLQGLEWLDLRGTAVSDQAAAQLRQALPQCEVQTHVTCRCRQCGEFFGTRDVTGQTHLCPSCTDPKPGPTQIPTLPNS